MPALSTDTFLDVMNTDRIICNIKISLKIEYVSKYGRSNNKKRVIIRYYITVEPH